jgi:hypothetical protein
MHDNGGAAGSHTLLACLAAIGPRALSSLPAGFGWRGERVGRFHLDVIRKRNGSFDKRPRCIESSGSQPSSRAELGYLGGEQPRYVYYARIIFANSLNIEGHDDRVIVGCFYRARDRCLSVGDDVECNASQKNAVVYALPADDSIPGCLSAVSDPKRVPCDLTDPEKLSVQFFRRDFIEDPFLDAVNGEHSFIGFGIFGNHPFIGSWFGGILPALPFLSALAAAAFLGGLL